MRNLALNEEISKPLWNIESINAENTVIGRIRLKRRNNAENSANEWIIFFNGVLEDELEILEHLSEDRTPGSTVCYFILNIVKHFLGVDGRITRMFIKN